MQCGGYKIIQDTEGFCYGTDAVLLANYAVPCVAPGSRVCDLCTGTGIIPLLLAAKTAGGHFTGIELQEQVAALAERSVRLNGAEERIRILQGDVRSLDALGLYGSFDVVTANPPYMKSGLRNQNSVKLLSRHEIACSFEDVAAAAARLLRSGGRFVLVHRPGRLVDVISLLRAYRLEPKRLRLVYTYADSEANLMLLEAVRDGKSQMKVEAPLILYREPGVFTDEVLRIYGRE